MSSSLSLLQFNTLFPDDDACLEEIKKLRYPKGIYCILCHTVTIHYKLRKRTAYSCKFCRNQIYPLSGTIFEKTTTPLQLWFFALFLLTHTKADISIKQLQRELGVTYKTAWRMYTSIRKLMAQNDSDLLAGALEFDDTVYGRGENKIHKWVFFNTIEFTVVQRQKSSK